MTNDISIQNKPRGLFPVVASTDQEPGDFISYSQTVSRNPYFGLKPPISNKVSDSALSGSRLNVSVCPAKGGGHSCVEFGCKQPILISF